jgi:hypothetical protein
VNEEKQGDFCKITKMFRKASVVLTGFEADDCYNNVWFKLFLEAWAWVKLLMSVRESLTLAL